MTLEEITELWSSDSKIDQTNISNAAIDIPKLHHKYYTIFSKERLSLRKLENDFKKLLLIKHEYYTGSLDRETLIEHGWQPNRRVILKSDIQMHIDADDDIINLTLKISYYKEKVYFLESIIKSIQDRNFLLKSIIDWTRFTAGA